MVETARQVLPTMGADQFYPLILIFKGAGNSLRDKKKVLENILAALQNGTLDLPEMQEHPDGRAMVFHVIDSLYRAVEFKKFDRKTANEPYSAIIEECCAKISNSSITFQMQDISALLRVLHHYPSSSAGVLGTLQKVGQEMFRRMGQPGEFANNFIQNMKLFATKYLDDEKLFGRFFQLVVKDVNLACSDQCRRKHEPKHCHALTFLDFAAVLEIFSMVGFEAEDKIKFHKFLEISSNKMMDRWDEFLANGYNEKLIKLASVLKAYQIFGFYPTSFLMSQNVERFMANCQTNSRRSTSKFFEFYEWYEIKKAEYEVSFLYFLNSLTK